MSSTHATRDDGTAEINDRTFAAYMVIEEHDRLAKGIMALVDMIGDFQEIPERARAVNVENLRKATARMFYESRRNLTDGLLFAIDIGDSTPLDETVIDAIAKSGEEAGEQHKRIDAEIKSEEGEDR